MALLVVGLAPPSTHAGGAGIHGQGIARAVARRQVRPGEDTDVGFTACIVFWVDRMITTDALLPSMTAKQVSGEYHLSIFLPCHQPECPVHVQEKIRDACVDFA